MRVGHDGGVCALRSKLGGALKHNQCSDSGRPRRENRGIPRLGLRFGERLRADYSPKEESSGQGVAQFEAAPLSAPSPRDTSVLVPRKGSTTLSATTTSTMTFRTTALTAWRTRYAPKPSAQSKHIGNWKDSGGTLQ